MCWQQQKGSWGAEERWWCKIQGDCSGVAWFADCSVCVLQHPMGLPPMTPSDSGARPLFVVSPFKLWWDTHWAGKEEDSFNNSLLLLGVYFNPVTVGIKYSNVMNALSVPTFNVCQLLLLETCFPTAPLPLLTAWVKVCIWVSQVSRQIAVKLSNVIP